MTDARGRFSVALTCPNCGQAGAVTWEESTANERPRGPERRLIELGPGFHTETGRTQSGDALIICDACDQIQAD